MNLHLLLSYWGRDGFILSEYEVLFVANRPFDPSPLHFSLLRQLVDTPRHYAVTGKLRVTMYFERVMNALNSTPATLTVKSSAYKS